MIFRIERVILPANLQQTITKSAHMLGHLGMTKTKQMLRWKYWFPCMNHLISQTSGSGSCFDCPAATKRHRQEPIRQSVIPGGPYPDGHYNLVAIDQRTRYPVAEVVSSTGFKQTKKKLKNTFAYLGIPRRVTSDNWPPFNSEQFKDFAKGKGFVHHRASTNHLRANTQVERFMQTLNKTEQIAHLQGKSGPNRDMTV